MAYQARGRDPLFDSDMQAALEKRGKELLGIALVVVGLLAAGMIATYTPDDPNWMSATDAPVQNFLGRFGASISAPLFMIIGGGSWAIALVAIAWGMRFAFHQGADLALSRAIFTPIAVALAAIYAATLVPGDSWTHAFGLGGLFGDTILGAILSASPFGAGLTLNVLSVIFGLMALVLTLFVMGVTAPELRWGMRFLIVGLIMTYATLLTMLGRGANGAVQAAHTIQAKRQDRREAAMQENGWAEALGEDDLYEEQEYVEEKPSLLSRVPGLVKRPEPMLVPEIEPELVEPTAVADIEEHPGDDRIKEKIADVVKARLRRKQVVYAPDLTMAQDQQVQHVQQTPVQPAAVQPTAAPVLRAEPPLTAPQAPVAPQPTAAPQNPAAVQSFVPQPAAPIVEPTPQPQPQASFIPPAPEAADDALIEPGGTQTAGLGGVVATPGRLDPRI